MVNRRILTRLMVSAAGLAIGVAIGVASAPDASAFDLRGWATDGYETCFTGSDWTTAEKARVTDAMSHWESVVYLLDIDHSSTGSCPSSKVEIDWVTDLGGSLASTSFGPAGPTRIRFARWFDDADPIPWYFGSSGTIPSYQYDFRSTASHELGHGLGLKHPEKANQYPYHSYDGFTPVMKANAGAKGVNRRTLRQDDRAGGEWARRRNILVGPTADTVGYWGWLNGSLYDCGSYLCLSKNANASYSAMFMTTRLTTVNKSKRGDPGMHFLFRGSTYSTGMVVSAMARSNTVDSSGNIGSFVYAYGSWCTDTLSSNSFQACDVSELNTIWETDVADVRLYIRNLGTGEPSSSGTVHIDRTYATFADAPSWP